MTSNIKKQFIIEGLDCANCALEIENEVRNIEGIKKANLDFFTKKLTIEFQENIETDNILEKASKIARSIESCVKIIEENSSVNGAGPADLADKKRFFKLGIGALIFAAAIIIPFPLHVNLVLYLLSYILVGGPIVLNAARNIVKGKLFDESFLMSIATVGAFAVGEFPEGVAVMLFYEVGEIFQSVAVNHSRKSIKALMDIRPEYANLKTEDGIKKVSPEEVEIGSIIIVRPGEKIPLDGKVADGESTVDTSALTGESLPKDIKKGSEVLSGFINGSGLIHMEVTKRFCDSAVSKILDLVQNASSRKASTENFITKFAKYYTPVVVFSAAALALVPPLIIPDAKFSDWLYRALIFLVISCPCALVISIPLGFFGGIGGASRNGILIKGGNFLEALNNVDMVVFDKTGTLTKGVFKVTRIEPYGNISMEELLEYAAYAEAYSNHPIAFSILKAYGKEIDKNIIESFDEIPGHGTRVKMHGIDILAGNEKLMSRENIEADRVKTAGTVIHAAINGKYAGYIVISDELKPDTAKAIQGLKLLGIRKTAVLTGDNKFTAQQILNLPGIDDIYADLLPHEKVEKLEMLDKKKPVKKNLIFVGDGINDAPVLARADIGIAMGGLGSDAAIEAADIVIMNDEPSKLISVLKIAKRTRRIVWQNIVFALAVKGAVLLLGAGGISTMWEAVFADVGVAVLAILNSMRVLNTKNI